MHLSNNIQNVATVGQRKTLGARLESNTRPSVHWSGALTTELLGGVASEVIFTRFVVTCVLNTARISNAGSVKI